MANRVFEETKFRLDGYPAWKNTDPIYKDKTTYPDGTELHIWESWGPTVLIHERKDDAEKIIQDFKALVDDEIFKERIHSIIEHEELWEIEISIFRNLIQQESEKILLGNDMKGKCTICKQFSILSKIFNQ